MKYRVELDGDAPRASMQRYLLRWLSQASWTTDELVEFLEGYRLPPVGHDEDPYVWIMRGLPRQRQQHTEASRELATRLAALLETAPEVAPVGRKPERVLYNGLWLATQLAIPEVLAPSLRAMRERRAIDGHWLGRSLRSALLSALTYNQSDAELRELWFSLLSGEKDYLGGSVYEGFDGILQMPDPERGPGNPAVDDLAPALSIMIAHLDKAHSSERRIRFRRLLGRIESTYQRFPWQRELLNIADANGWPEWAVLCLPSLFIEIGHEGSPPGHYLVWSEILESLPESAYEDRGRMCEEMVADVVVPPHLIHDLQRVASFLEEGRRCLNYPSNDAVRAALSASWLAVDLDTLEQSDVRDRVVQCRNDTLRERGVAIASSSH